MPEWSRVVNTTIRKYVRGEEVAVLRNRKLTALLLDRGRVKFNDSGEQLDWKVRYKRAPLFGYADSDTLTFSRRNRWKTALLPWRGYATTDSITKKERLMNKSTEAIVKLYDSITKVLMEDIEDQFCDELYIDGNASGNSKRMHGVESFLADNDQTFNVSTGAARSQNAADPAGVAADTYAGLNTAQANFGGTWSGSWPSGTGDAHYDFWSPLLVNYTSTAFTGSTWAANAKDAIRYMIIMSQKNKSRRGMLDLVLLTNDLFRQFLDIADDAERFISRPGRTEGSLAKLGFTDMVNFDGAEVTWEYGVPSAVGYGFNVDKLTLHSLQNQLFVPEGPDFDIASQSYRFSIDFFGNLEAQPRAQAKLLAMA